jgi:hypothetical protein
MGDRLHEPGLLLTKEMVVSPDFPSPVAAAGDL